MTYPSVYEITSPLSSVMKNHFVSWFSGKELPPEWTVRNISGAGAQGFANEVDSGYRIRSDTSSQTQTKIDFDNVRPFSPTGSSVTWIHKPAFKNSSVIWVTGFGNNKNMNEWSQLDHQAVCFVDSDDSVFKLRTENTVGNTDVAGSASVSIGYHAENIVCKSSSCDMSIDGVLEAVSTGTLPTIPMQPYFNAANRGSQADSWHYLLMCEAFNT